MQISFKSEIKQLTEDLKKIKKEAIPIATRQALNRTVKGVNTDSVRSLSKQTSIKQKDIRPALKITQANKNSLKAGLDAKEGKAKNLINFVSPGKRKPGAFNQSKTLKSGKRRFKHKGVKAKAWGESKVYEGTFIGRGRTHGKPLVFARTSDKRRPLKSILGPSIRRIFDKRPHQRLMEKSARERFEKNMRAAVANQLRRATNAR